MLSDVGMVQMYSKSANVNDRHGFCMDRLPPLFPWTGPPPCSYGFSARWFAMPFRDILHHLLHLPLFWRKHFRHPCFLTFYGMQIAHGQWLIYLKGFQTTVATKECVPIAWQGVLAHCGMWLGGQLRVGCGG